MQVLDEVYLKKKNPFSERLEISAATSDQLTTEGLLPDPFGNI